MDGLLWSLFFCVYFFSAVVVKFTPVSDLDSNKRVSIGDPIVLYCEVSHPFGKVSWFKDGEELQVTDGLNIQSDGNMRRVVIQSADASHAGVYTCETSGEVIKFNVDVAGRRSLGQFSYSYTFGCQLLTSIPPPVYSGPPVEFSPVPEEELQKSSMELDPVVLLCHVSADDAEVVW